MHASRHVRRYLGTYAMYVYIHVIIFVDELCMIQHKPEEFWKAAMPVRFDWMSWYSGILISSRRVNDAAKKRERTRM
jgi:hypothetical protein